ncbi:hypothetical protein OEA41_000231 [Lepraria neglecta]|uniref:Uncharacterized protein n=1 Tax=Lepraria neglecta TaxID=209136 RepID=A0AAD9ZG82_9LECA|nr:hypothetical protein OEA41_000231 [Lepraria neglecta]
MMNALINVGWNWSKPAVRKWNFSEEEFATKIWRLNETELQDLYKQVKLDNLGQEISRGVNFMRNPSILDIPSAISKRTNQKNRLELIENRMKHNGWEPHPNRNRDTIPLARSFFAGLIFGNGKSMRRHALDLAFLHVKEKTTREEMLGLSPLEDAEEYGVIDETTTSVSKPLRISAKSPDDIQVDQGSHTETMGSPPDLAQEDEHSKKKEALILTMSSLSDKLRMLSTKEDDEVVLSEMEVHHLTNNLSIVTEFATYDLDSPENDPSFDLTRVLLWAASEGHTILINPMLNLRADVQAKQNGCTALMLAVGKGHLEPAQQIVSAGATA